MRAKGFLIVTALALCSPIPAALAQEGQEVDYIDYGGVLLPVPSTLPEGPRQIAPGEPAPSEAEEDQVVRGRTGGRVEVDPTTGEERRVFQSTRVAGVSVSSTRDRFSWFYDAIELYTGIIPHLRDTLPHISAYQQAGQQAQRPNSVTWIGFQPFGGYTRVFVQCSRPPQYQVLESEQGHLVELMLDNTRLSLSNFTRFMDTSYFGRSVDLIDAEQLDGRRVRVVIWRDEVAPYTVTLDGDYLYVDFRDVRGY